MTNSTLKELANKLTRSENLITDFTGYENYRHDATIEIGNPSAIIFAETESDIIAAINFCNNHDLSIAPRGAGTGLSGGCVPTKGSIVLSMERMTNLKIDAPNKIAYAESGVITKTLFDEAAKHGLTYPPDPASYEESTLGGNVAENAGGLRCVKYGVTKDYVIGMKGITSDGQLIKTGIYNENRGFSLGDIFIGSEGTLVLITEIALRLIDTPEAGETILVAFNSPENAAQTVTDITRSGIVPTVMEFLDGDAAACSNEYEQNEGLDNVAAILLIETSPPDTAKVEQFCQNNNCSFIRKESDPAKADQLWKIRRNLSNAIKETAEIRISEDVAVPNSKFPELVAFVAEMNRRSPLRINSFGHAGDGNLHVNFLSKSGSDDDRQLIEGEIVTLLNKTMELGGTLSGEHGIGLAKKKYLPLEFDKSTLSYMKMLKSVFDPKNILNPDKIY